MQRGFWIGVVVAGLLNPTASLASAEIHRVEVTLFMPCDNATAVRAAASLQSVPGVTDVELVAGELEVTIETGPDFTGDPLDLVQRLWDGRIYPNRIYLQATGRIDQDELVTVFHARGTGQRFRVLDNETLRRLRSDTEEGSLVRIEAEVVDWIEDRTLEQGRLYTLKLLDAFPS